MKQFTLSQAARYLNLHRTTIARLSDSGALPPDDHTGGGRRIWSKQTLDSYRLMQVRVSTFAYVDSSALPELSLNMSIGQTVFGHAVVSVPLPDGGRAECFSALSSFLARSRPGALILPACTHTHHIQRTVVDLCSSSGISVLLWPQ